MTGFFAKVLEKTRSINKKVWIALLVVVVAGGAGYSYLSNRGIKVATADFSFTTPGKWEQVDLKGSGLESQIAASVRRKDRAASFHVTASTSKTKIDFKSLPAALKKSFSKSLKNFEEISVRTQKVDGFEALRYEYRYLGNSTGGGAMTVHQEQIIVQAGEKVYYLVGQSYEGNYAAIRPQLARIFDSFDFR